MIDNGYLKYTCGNPCCGGSVNGDCSCDDIFLAISNLDTDIRSIEDDLQVVEDKIKEIEISGGVTTDKVEEMLMEYTYDREEIDRIIDYIERPDNLVSSIAFENGSIVAKNLSDVTLSTVPATDILSLIRVENNTLIIP